MKMMTIRCEADPAFRVRELRMLREYGIAHAWVFHGRLHPQATPAERTQLLSSSVTPQADGTP